MYKIMFKMYTGNRDMTAKNYIGASVYPGLYSSVKSAQNSLRTHFGINSRQHKEKLTAKLAGQNVIISYTDPSFDTRASARFYIVEV